MQTRLSCCHIFFIIIISYKTLRFPSSHFLIRNTNLTNCYLLIIVGSTGSAER
ncbi:hypothetical protein HMPREF3190_00340 [Umbribacter vaginalis]|nr:hypothetical protein HMPREF3190_00340 [Coriobacteriales bacterium DNF00809]